MTNPNERIRFDITLPVRGYQVLQLDAKRLGIMNKGRYALQDLLLLYAEEINKEPGQTIKLTRSYMRSFRGERTRISIALPRWAWETLRERARRRGFLWGKKGSISWLIQNHAANLSEKYRTLAPDEIMLP